MKHFFVVVLTSLFTLLPTDQAQSATLDQLLQTVMQEQQVKLKETREREQAFLNEKAKQKQLLIDAKAELKILEDESNRLKVAFEANEKSLVEVEGRLKLTMGTLGELFGVVRQIAGDTKAQFENSLTTVQFPKRLEFLTELASAKAIPSIDKLNQLWQELFQEIVLSGQVVKFKAEVTSKDGAKESKDVIRVGLFNAVSEGNFLTYVPETQQLTELGRQPSGQFLKQAENLAEAKEYTKFPIDPSRGSILALLVQAPSMLERLDQGGLVGYIILALLLVGIIIVGERLFYLTKLSKKLKVQEANVKADTNNPLGQLLAVFEQNTNEDAENLELKLNEVILKSTPPIERGIKTIKLLAAVAPLLGLLGTVTGMIGTFQAITLFGTGDPKLMAGGISQALITTVLGLVAAIPLLLLHSYISGRSNRIVEFLEEQSAGIVASRSGSQLGSN